MYQRCIEQQTPPDMEPGDTTVSGEFLRNLKKKHVAKRYQDDDDNNPTYGFKLTKKCWTAAAQQPGNLSVNLRSCIHSAECSIALQVDSEYYYHVATINLDVLNLRLSSPLVAVHQPVDSLKNLCHFEIAPLDGTVSIWQEVAVLFDQPFPSCNFPQSDEDKAKAASEYEVYRSFLDIRRWVRGRDGSLPAA